MIYSVVTALGLSGESAWIELRAFSGEPMLLPLARKGGRWGPAALLALVTAREPFLLFTKTARPLGRSQ